LKNYYHKGHDADQTGPHTDSREKDHQAGATESPSGSEKDHAGVLLNEVLNETAENRSSREHCRLIVNSTIAMAVKKRHSKIQLA
jgi:hypothetical protein